MNQLENQKPDNQRPAGGQLAFEAMSYVLDEMSATEKDVFGRRLIDDQSAREALADAVQICQLVTEIFDDVAFDEAALDVQPAAQAETIWRWPARWTALAVAASIVLAVFVAGLDRGRSPTAVVAANVDSGGRLAVAWANAPSLSETADSDGFTDDATTEVGSLAGADDSTDEANSDEGADAGSVGVAPADSNDWLYEALTASHWRGPLSLFTVAVRGEG